MSSKFDEFIFNIVSDLVLDKKLKDDYQVMNKLEEKEVVISYTRNNQQENAKFNRKITGLISKPSYKFLDYVEWNTDHVKKTAIVIGYNPSLSLHDNLDRTNKNIFRFLDKYEYGRYYLLNYYPLVSPNPEDVDNSNFNKDFVNKITDIINENNKIYKLDIIIVWGKMEVPFDKNLVTALNEAIKNNVLFVTTYNNEIKHMSLRGILAEDVIKSKVESLTEEKGIILITPR